MNPEQKELKKQLRQRTLAQNRALHLYYRKLAQALNEAGLEMKKVLKLGIEIPWTEESIKNHLWRPIQKSLIGVVSTKDQNKGDVSLVYETLNRHLGEKFGVFVPFPSEAQLLEAEEATRKLNQ